VWYANDTYVMLFKSYGWDAVVVGEGGCAQGGIFHGAAFQGRQKILVGVQ